MEDKNTGTNKNKEENNIDDLDLNVDFSNSDEEKSNETIKESDSVTISRSKLVLAKKLIENIKENNEKLIQLLAGTISLRDEERISIGQIGETNFDTDDQEKENGSRIIEGVFDGENMIGPDGKQYSMPANYASKSKLVEGDIMKLTITPTGTFVYKQIGPIERIRVVGRLESNGSGGFIVNVENKKYKVLTASVTYFKGQDGDEVVILLPKNGDSNWAAVENVVRNN